MRNRLSEADLRLQLCYIRYDHSHSMVVKVWLSGCSSVPMKSHNEVRLDLHFIRGLKAEGAEVVAAIHHVTRLSPTRLGR
jgi:hypothetical protein